MFRYQWIKNGKKFEYATYDDRISRKGDSGSLTISKPKEEDLGQYQCFATNELGTATSNSVFVRKAELNSFKDEIPKTEYADEGKPHTLNCQPPDGWPKPYVYWLLQDKNGAIKSINNSRMTVDPEGNLHFSNVTMNDASVDSYYACAATSMFRNEYKLGNKVVLVVRPAGASAGQNKHAPLRQYVTKKNEVAYRGQTAELFCIYGGTPLPYTIWTKNGKPIRMFDRVTQGNYGKSLVIKHVDANDEGTYTCEMSNGVGSADSYTIHLQVLAAPYFTKEPQVTIVAEDERAEIFCEAEGTPRPEIKWIYNGKPISEARANTWRKVTSNSIVIEKVSNKDTGNYGCNATNSLGYVYKDVYINVLALPPEITQPPTHLNTVDGKTIRMTCNVFGAPTPEVKWIRSGRELTGGRYKILETGDLEIQNVIYLDAGEYTCHASNRFGKAEASGTLVVKEHTKITDGPEDYEVAAGSTATFR